MPKILLPPLALGTSHLRTALGAKVPLLQWFQVHYQPITQFGYFHSIHATTPLVALHLEHCLVQVCNIYDPFCDVCGSGVLFLQSRRQFIPARLAIADSVGWFPGRTPRGAEQVQLAQGGYFLTTYVFTHLRANPR